MPHLELTQGPANSSIEFPPGQDIPQLTGVRAIAAWMVFAYHNRDSITSGTGPAAMLLGQAHIGVNIFFVLSGFLIPWRYANSMALKPSWWIKYARNRVARIYPLATLITTLWLLAWGERSLSVWLNCIFLTKAFNPKTLYAGVPQAWTLTVEECFYFMAPFIVVWGRGRSPAKWLGSLTVVFWTAGLCIYGPLHLVAHMAQFTIFGRCFEFFAGMMLANLLTQPRLRTGRRCPVLTIVGIASTLIGMFAMAAAERLKLPWSAWMALNNFVIPSAVAILFGGLILERSPIRWLLATPPMVFCGKISYAFYLIHHGDLDDHLAAHGFSLVERFVLLMGFAALLYAGFEEPLRKLIRGSRRYDTGTKLAGSVH